MYQRYFNKLQQLEQENNLRLLPGKFSDEAINLSSNDYLGLNDDYKLREEFLNSILNKNIRFSAASSRLLTGNCDACENLENNIAHAFGRESCLIYNSGYHANIGILPCLAGKKDLLLADKLVHASIIDGMQLSQAEMMRYNHLDYEHLEHLLQKYRNDFEQAFIVTESIFSMDGDKADLQQLIELKKKYNCFIYVDEAHAFGIYGETGLGCVEAYDCIRDCDFIVATFGKAMASVGAFLVCDNVIKQYLVNHSRSLIYTTALPPVNLEWTLFIFKLFPSFQERRQNLSTLSKEFSQWLGIPYNSHIIPFITGSNESAVNLSNQLRKIGVHVLPIRYPTVPKGKARLRFSLTANLTLAQLQIIPQLLEKYEPALDK